MSNTWSVIHAGNTRQFDILDDAVMFAARIWNASGGDLVRVIDAAGNIVEEFEG